MICKNIQKTRARDKATKVLELITRKVEKEETKKLLNLPSLKEMMKKNEELLKKYKREHKKLNEEYQKKEQKLNKTRQEFQQHYERTLETLKKHEIIGTIPNRFNEKKSLKYIGCVVSKKELEELQKAQNLADLGMRKEANKIFDKYIKKYELDQ